MSVRYLVYKLLHPLHGMVSLQQRCHSHETFITVPVILFLLVFSSSVVLFVYFFIITLWDTLTGEKSDTVRSDMPQGANSTFNILVFIR